MPPSLERSLVLFTLGLAAASAWWVIDTLWRLFT